MSASDKCIKVLRWLDDGSMIRHEVKWGVILEDRRRFIGVKWDGTIVYDTFV